MVVEDEPSIYDMLMTMFQMWGIDGVAFVTGEEAVAWIDDVDAGRFKGELPELVLLDFRLPGAIQGPDVGARLRRSPKLGNVAIVLTSAYLLSEDEVRDAMKTSGADHYIRKPLPRVGEFKRQLEETIAKRRAMTPAVVAEAAAPAPAAAPKKPAAAKTRRPRRTTTTKPKPRSK